MAPPPRLPRNCIPYVCTLCVYSLFLFLASDARVGGGARARSALFFSAFAAAAAARVGAVAANRSTLSAARAYLSLSCVFF